MKIRRTSIGRKLFLERVPQTLINQEIYRKRFLHFYDVYDRGDEK